MLSIKAIFIFLVASNLAALLVISYNYYSFRSLNGTLIESSQSNVSILADPPKFLFETNYKFEDPVLAAKILQKLDEFTPIGSGNYLKDEKGVATNKHSKPFFGLISNDKYCEKHREYFTKNANDLFEKMNFMTDAATDSLFRNKVIPSLGEVGQDLQPNVGSHMSKNEKSSFIHNIRPETHVFYTGNNMYEHKNLGQQFSCFSQASNHIPGHAILNTKEGLSGALNKYSKKFGANKLECFNIEKFRPRTWDLSDKKECEDFFKRLVKSEEETLITFLKRTSSDAEGNESYQPITDEEGSKLNTTYESGKLCGKVTEKTLIQKYVSNPLLVNNHKFDMRVYLLIASTHPFIAYYHDGYARISPFIYDSASNEKGSMMASYSDQVQNSAAYTNGLTAAELEGAEKWSFNKLQSYLIEKKIVTDADWFDKTLRLNLKKSMVHILRATTANLVEKNNVYELFAMDFMLDEDLNLVLLDSTSNNLFTHSSEEDDRASVKMLKDHFEIVFGLIRSRVKRGINYINRLIQEKNVSQNDKGEFELKNEVQKKLEFLELTKNYFEPEYEPTRTNGFTKIMDANYYSFQRYNWIMDRECLF